MRHATPWVLAALLLVCLHPATARGGKDGGDAGLKERCARAVDMVLAQGPWQRGDSLDLCWELPSLAGLPASLEAHAEALQLRERGTGTVALRLMDGDRVVRRYTLPVRVRRWERCAVASHDLPRGALLQVTDVEERWLETTRAEGGALPNAQQVLGRRLSRMLAAGRPVMARQMEAMADIRRGEALRVTVRSGAVCITANGEALEDGCLGLPLKVRLVETGRQLEARLVAPGEAEVEVATR